MISIVKHTVTVKGKKRLGVSEEIPPHKANSEP